MVHKIEGEAWRQLAGGDVIDTAKKRKKRGGGESDERRNRKIKKETKHTTK